MKLALKLRPFFITLTKNKIVLEFYKKGLTYKNFSISWKYTSHNFE